MNVNSFFALLAADLNILSVKTGIPKYQLQRFSRSNHIPLSYLAIFLVEADVARVALPIQLFSSMYAPKTERLEKMRRGRKSGERFFLRMFGLAIK